MDREDESDEGVDAARDDQLDVTECRERARRPLDDDQEREERRQTSEQRHEPRERDEPIHPRLTDEGNLTTDHSLYNNNNNNDNDNNDNKKIITIITIITIIIIITIITTIKK